MRTHEADSAFSVTIPRLVVLEVTVIVVAIPFVLASVSATDGVLQWVLWVGAGLAVVYLIVTE